MIKANEVTIYDLLGTHENSQIRIPDYQRGYSWENKEVQEFFTDVSYFSDIEILKRPDSPYFLGPIVLMRGDYSDVYYYAVDGQQRISTFIMLLCVIRDLSSSLCGDAGVKFGNKVHTQYINSIGLNGGSRMSLKLGDLDHRFYEQFVLKQDRKSHLVPRNKSNGLIKKARNLIENLLREKISTQPEPLTYMENLYNNITHKVIMVAIEVKGERDAMNVFERINVRGKPLSESDLIRHKLMSSSNKGDRKNLRNKWDSLENMLGGEEAKIDGFLSHMWASRRGETKGIKLYDEISLYLEETETTPLEFVDEFVDDCNIYINLLKTSSNLIHHESRESVRITHATLGAKQALPLFLSAYRRFEKTPEFSKLALAVEALVVRHHYFAGHDTSELKVAFYKAAKQINDARSKEQALKSAMNTLIKINPTDSQVIAGIQRQMKINKLPALYILRQLENLTQNGAFEAQATLEHIFPQNASSKEWGLNAERLKPYISHLGNLTLLTSSDNSKASNRNFSHKKSKVYKTSNLKLTSEIIQFRSWGKQPIRRRAESLAKLANKRWKL